MKQCKKLPEFWGNDADAEKYNAKKDQIRKLIQDQLFDPSRHIYGSGSQIDLTYPLLAGVVPDSLVSIVRKNLFNEIEINHKGHIACGLVGIPVFTEWALKIRKSTLCIRSLRRKIILAISICLTMVLQLRGNTGTVPEAGYTTAITASDPGFTRRWEGYNPMRILPGYRHFTINPQVPAGSYLGKCFKGDTIWYCYGKMED